MSLKEEVLTEYRTSRVVERIKSGEKLDNVPILLTVADDSVNLLLPVPAEGNHNGLIAELFAYGNTALSVDGTAPSRNGDGEFLSLHSEINEAAATVALRSPPENLARAMSLYLIVEHSKPEAEREVVEDGTKIEPAAAVAEIQGSKDRPQTDASKSEALLSYSLLTYLNEHPGASAAEIKNAYKDLSSGAIDATLDDLSTRGMIEIKYKLSRAGQESLASGKNAKEPDVSSTPISDAAPPQRDPSLGRTEVFMSYVTDHGSITYGQAHDLFPDADRKSTTTQLVIMKNKGILQFNPETGNFVRGPNFDTFKPRRHRKGAVAEPYKQPPEKAAVPIEESQASSRRYDRQSGLTMQECAILYLGDKNSGRARDLKIALDGFSPISVEQRLKTMAQYGLAKRDGGKRTPYRLTDEGKEVYKTLLEKLDISAEETRAQAQKDKAISIVYETLEESVSEVFHEPALRAKNTADNPVVAAVRSYLETTDGANLGDVKRRFPDIGYSKLSSAVHTLLHRGEAEKEARYGGKYRLKKQTHAEISDKKIVDDPKAAYVESISHASVVAPPKPSLIERALERYSDDPRRDLIVRVLTRVNSQGGIFIYPVEVARSLRMDRTRITPLMEELARTGYLLNDGGKYRLTERNHERPSTPSSPSVSVKILAADSKPAIQTSKPQPKSSAPSASASYPEKAAYALEAYEGSETRGKVETLLGRLAEARPGIMLTTGQMTRNTGIEPTTVRNLLEELVNLGVVDKGDKGYAFGSGKRAEKPQQPSLSAEAEPTRSSDLTQPIDITVTAKELRAAGIRIETTLPRQGAVKSEAQAPPVEAKPAIPSKPYEPTKKELDLIRAVHNYGKGSDIGLRVLGFHSDIGMTTQEIAKAAPYLVREGYLTQTHQGVRVSDKSAAHLGLDLHQKIYEESATAGAETSVSYTERVIELYHTKGESAFVDERVLLKLISREELSALESTGLLKLKSDGYSLTGRGKEQLKSKYGD